MLNAIRQYYPNDKPKNFNLGDGTPTLVLENSGTGDEAYGIRPLDFFDYDDNTYGLLYLAQASSGTYTRIIKLATAPKLNFNHNWTKQGVVINNGTGGDWDYEIGSASVTKSGNTWIVAYESYSIGVVGIATGTDLLALTKHPSNPILDNTATAFVFNRYLRHVNVNTIGDTVFIHYEGRLSNPRWIENSKIGYATAVFSCAVL